ncbi:unnamed protein product [Rotaria sp. Silwood2]|nr:unnamed protein product [Rotaria sp. Silwood2]CAF2518376.1 unnamed protein product [Rotaria sp. Silwood2]CAF2755595.1 unnamed protein product [Rotaria sp. Silwood2]CAF2915287.1 unnamed protein product [Rotaria sp. Silwood2]CAF3892293.1 unnamed protein product [Rotaria sp. Silwood2]
MPSNTRWTLNPRKWFGTISYTGQKHEKNNNSLPAVPTTATTTTRTITLTNPRLSTGKSKTKVIPISISNDVNKTTTTMVASITQLQLPAFSIRRERISSLLPSQATFTRQNTFVQSHTEPSIRKNGRFEQQLSIDTTRYNTQPTSTTNDETLKHGNIQQNFPTFQAEMSLSNMSRQCLVDYPRYSANVMKEFSTPTRSSSSSSLYDGNDNSSSSGIYTDERQRTESKDTLSILEALSAESIADSQTSLNHCPTRPMIHHYRRPMSDLEKIDDKLQQRQNSLIRSHRSHSAEGILKDNQIMSPTKSRQSSAAIIKKIEKRLPTNRSPTTKLEKAGFIRIGNDTYRLNTNKVNYLSHSRKNSIDSFVPYSNYDDPLRSANNEECYAALPRTSSTEQLNNNIHNDLRIIVDGCIRPMVTSISRNRFTKNQQQRYRRPHVHNDHTQLNIEHITDKLLSSVDCSTYARYQRCY